MSKMTTLKLLKFPLEVIILFAIVISLFYFRPVIFHKNVTEPVDFAFSLIEDKFDFTIPVYQSDDVSNQAGSSYVEDISLSNETPDIKVEEAYDEMANQSDDAVTMADIELLPAETQVPESEEQVSVAEEQVSVSEEMVQNEGPDISDINKSLESLTNKISVISADNNGYQQLSAKLDGLISQFENLRNLQMQQEMLPQTESVIEDESLSNENINATELIKLARISFWNGEIDTSEKYYLDVLNTGEANADIFGELGNVYYSQGKWKQAGEAYYQAAVRLHDLKQVNQVNYLLRIIQGLDKESADKLRQKMSG